MGRPLKNCEAVWDYQYKDFAEGLEFTRYGVYGSFGASHAVRYAGWVLPVPSSRKLDLLPAELPVLRPYSQQWWCGSIAKPVSAACSCCCRPCSLMAGKSLAATFGGPSGPSIYQWCVY